ncbi:Mur ligase family protein [Beduini massiliensis]|uniref:Mur ligase family protein n=1 Tax=Beduini massiliensis TaxID=1585974 RepID=UPI000693A8A6|nr:UDP-N-acetylmuramoyl-L-alanyl-D-glutamate--2,6-diaminopimelate ligase [Beduini massiliensis]
MQLNTNLIINILSKHDLLISAPQVDIQVESISFHSKKLGHNCLFVCKGNNFKKEYLEAILHSLSAYISEVDYDVNLPLILVKDVLKAMALLADALYDYPSRDLNLIGITGTKGKTSSLYFLKSILDAHSKEGDTAYLGSVEIYNGDHIVPSLLTTPESLTLQQIFRDVKENGKKNVIMEVSSQALKYDRVYGIEYQYGIFLNISNDHISDVEHPTFQDYIESKLKLFNHSKVCIINADLLDYLSEELKKQVYTFSLTQEATIKAEDIEMDTQGSHFNILYKGETYPIYLSVPGLFNIENVLSVILVALDMGIPMKDIQYGLAHTSVPGRMKQFNDEHHQIASIVDYAHNDASFTQIFKYARQFYPDYHIKAVFGCPGDKAFNRRHELGQAANCFADEIYLVPDDSGHEDIEQINRQIAEVITDKPYYSFEDREVGIQKAFMDIEGPTIVMVLGKGNETTQKVNGTTVPYPGDEEVVKASMRQFANKEVSL